MDSNIYAFIIIQDLLNSPHGGVGVHCDDVLKAKYAGTGHLFAITTWALIYHCYFIHLRWCKYQPCYGAC